MTAQKEVWVIDSSSIIAVREQYGRAKESQAFAVLAAMVASAELLWPPEVSREVEAVGNPDLAAHWVRARRSTAERTASFDTVKAVLARSPLLVDVHAQHEQADPYVVALALDLMSGDLFAPSTTIITEDRRDKPMKLSLATAAGLHRIPTVPLVPFLTSRGVR